MTERAAQKNIPFIIRAVVKIMIVTVVAAPVFTFGAAAEQPAGPTPAKHAIVAPGDQAAVYFTCRFKNGETAISTDPNLSKDASVPKSTIFLGRDRSTPIKLIAGGDPSVSGAAQRGGFESELLYQLSRLIVGMDAGRKKTVEVSAPRMGDEKRGDHFLKMARVRRREKEIRMTPEEYKGRTGKTPETGKPYTIDPAVPGKIASVTEKEVVVKFSADPGTKVATPFGEGTIREYEDRYEIVIDARPGNLTRTGGIVGRIVRVDDMFITIDYGHPFGGETLSCDVLVESAVASGTRGPAGPAAVPGKGGGT